MLRRLSGGLLALIAALAIAQDTDAKPRTFTFGGGTELEFQVHGSNGYRLEVASFAGMIGVTATSRESAALYLVDSREHGKRGFEAKLPGVGRIAVEFHPQTVKRMPVFPGCSGRPGRRERGIFVGTINFHGERGYTEVTASRARGSITRSYRETCHESGGGGGGKNQGGLFDAVLLARQGGLSFSALPVQFGNIPTIIYMASKTTHSRGMIISRRVFAEGPVESLSVENPRRPTAAKAEPPAPFSGSAELGIAPDGTASWKGDLTVTLPGAGPTRLAGNGFEAQICVGRKCAGDDLGGG